VDEGRRQWTTGHRKDVGVILWLEHVDDVRRAPAAIVAPGLPSTASRCCR
jgi:hypothetical protein